MLRFTARQEAITRADSLYSGALRQLSQCAPAPITRRRHALDDVSFDAPVIISRRAYTPRSRLLRHTAVRIMRSKARAGRRRHVRLAQLEIRRTLKRHDEARSFFILRRLGRFSHYITTRIFNARLFRRRARRRHASACRHRLAYFHMQRHTKVNASARFDTAV